MKSRSDRKIILVTRKTRLDGLIKRFNTISQAQFYIEHFGDDFEDYQHEHRIYYRNLKACTIALSRLGRLQVLDRSFLPNYSFGKDDIIVVLGQDGLVANTIKYLNQNPIIGINPDPSRWDGILLPFKSIDLMTVIPEVILNQRPFREITIAELKLNTGESMYAVNDFFIGPKTHTSARYVIETSECREEQSSSGIIVSTGLGSTGWFKSLITGAVGMSNEISGKNIKVNATQNFKWESQYLYFTVREPFPSTNSSAEIVFGKITRDQSLKLISRMPGHGVIFSDGIESDFIEFNSGTEATIFVSKKRGRIVQ